VLFLSPREGKMPLLHRFPLGNDDHRRLLGFLSLFPPPPTPGFDGGIGPFPVNQPFSSLRSPIGFLQFDFFFCVKDGKPFSSPGLSSGFFLVSLETFFPFPRPARPAFESFPVGPRRSSTPFEGGAEGPSFPSGFSRLLQQGL